MILRQIITVNNFGLDSRLNILSDTTLEIIATRDNATAQTDLVKYFCV